MIIVAPAVTQLSENATDTDFNIKRHSWNRSDQPLLCLCLLAVDLSNNLIHIHALSLILWWLMIAGEEQTSWRRKSDYNLWSQEIIITNEQAASCQKYPKSFSDFESTCLSSHSLYCICDVCYKFCTVFKIHYIRASSTIPIVWVERTPIRKQVLKKSKRSHEVWICGLWTWLVTMV